MRSSYFTKVAKNSGLENIHLKENVIEGKGKSKVEEAPIAIGNGKEKAKVLDNPIADDGAQAPLEAEQKKQIWSTLKVDPTLVICREKVAIQK